MLFFISNPPSLPPSLFCGLNPIRQNLLFSESLEIACENHPFVWSMKGCGGLFEGGKNRLTYKSLACALVCSISTSMSVYHPDILYGIAVKNSLSCTHTPTLCHLSIMLRRWPTGTNHWLNVPHQDLHLLCCAHKGPLCFLMGAPLFLWPHPQHDPADAAGICGGDLGALVYAGGCFPLHVLRPPQPCLGARLKLALKESSALVTQCTIEGPVSCCGNGGREGGV